MILLLLVLALPGLSGTAYADEGDYDWSDECPTGYDWSDEYCEGYDWSDGD